MENQNSLLRWLLVLVLAALSSTAASAQTPAPTQTPTQPAPMATVANSPSPSAPSAVQLRSLEQRVQALKERTWRAKARMLTLKETTLGGGTGATATLVHENAMGSGFRLIRLSYAIDGAQIFARSDELGESMYKESRIPILSGPIGPGQHTITVVAEYRGFGYGALTYLSKYTFQARGSHTLMVEEGNTVTIRARGYERGGANTPMEKRPAIEFKVTTGVTE